MKFATAVITGFITGAIAFPALADHNSNFGDNTGRTVAGVHDDRIDSNLQGAGNSTAMGKNSASVQASGSQGSYEQGGYPDTVVPGFESEEDYLVF